MEQKEIDKLRLEFESWLESFRDLRARTVQEYLYYFNRFNVWDGLSQEKINDFVARNNNNVVRSFIKNLIDFMKFKRRKDSSFPFSITFLNNLEIPKYRKLRRKLPAVISEVELKNLVENLKLEKLKIMAMLSFYCGLRISELVGITPNDFMWASWEDDVNKAGKLKIRKEIAKGGNERIVFVPNFLMVRILNYVRRNAKLGKGAPDKPLFLISGRTWQKKLREASIKTFGKPIHPHTLRHSCATWLLDSGMKIEEVKEILGHRSLNTTMIYIHLTNKQLYDKYEEILNTPVQERKLIEN